MCYVFLTVILVFGRYFLLKLVSICFKNRFHCWKTCSNSVKQSHLGQYQMLNFQASFSCYFRLLIQYAVTILAMYMFCCFLKIGYYASLLFYYGYDADMDWYSYHLLYDNKQMCAVEFLFCFTCAFGSVMIIPLVAVYVYYIWYHLYCILFADYESVPYKEDACTIRGRERQCDKKCNRHFVWLELLFSMLELLFKDGIQSGIVFSLYNSLDSSLARPSWHFIACSIGAHVKLIACFFTKLFGFGEGEEGWFNAYDCGGGKTIACIIGLLLSVPPMVLSVLSLVIALGG